MKKNIEKIDVVDLEKFKALDMESLEKVAGGVNLAKCYIGTMGSALVGSAGGPVGYWGGAMVGWATFCN